MQSIDSVSIWIQAAKAGDDPAAQKLWERYCRSLVAVARLRMTGLKRRVCDEEDVTQQAFAAFFKGMQAGRYPQLQDRHDLWALLVKITESKVLDLRRKDLSPKRGGGKVRGNSAIDILQAGPGPARGHEALIDSEPCPEVAAAAVEQFKRLQSLLRDDRLRRISQLKMEGYSQDEIAEQVGCVRETVSRKLTLIRAIWSKELDQ